MEPPHPETGAPAVIPPVIEPIIRGASVRNRIVTPYNADAFEAKLQAPGLLGKHPDIPSRLRNGFPIGDFDEPLTRSHTPHNHLHNSEQLDFVLQYALEQVQLGHMSGPYTQSEVEEKLGGPFMSSPIFLIDKAGSPGKYRVIQNCAFKNRDGLAVNDFIDPDDFPTNWGNADEVLEIVARAPPGTQAASLDIESAYRNIPALPSHKPFLVIQVHTGQFFIDHVCPFGPASGTGLQGQIMDAIVDILRESGFGEMKKWVDDLVSFRSPGWNGAYPYDVEDIFRLSKQLGIPWKRGKCFRYASRFVYVGFRWDLEDRWVALTREKRAKFLERLNTFLDKAHDNPVSLQDAQSIEGTLSHASFVYTWGKSYLADLFALTSSLKTTAPQPLPLPKSLVSDLQWWRGTLEQADLARSLALYPLVRALDVWVDASTLGVGVMIGGRSAAWKLAAGFEIERGDIMWAEMIALELACIYLKELGHNNVVVVVHCDNTSVIDAWDQGWSRMRDVNLSIRRTKSFCMSFKVWPRPEYVKSEDNKADSLSRGLITVISDRLPPISLPPELRKLLISM